MKKFKKMLAAILAVVMLIAYAPMAECFAAGPTEYTSAEKMEFNKLYIINLKAKDEYTGERNYLWYTFTPKTTAETKVEILQTALTGWNLDVAVFDSLIQEVVIRDKNKLDLKKDATYYLRLTGSYSRDGEVSFMLKTSADVGADTGSGNSSVPDSSNQTSGGSTGNNQSDGSEGNNQGNSSNGSNQGSSSNENNNQGIGSNGNNQDSDNSGIDSDFWDSNDNNGSGVYDDELPVPEITEVENGKHSVTVVWSCDDTDNIDGYYVYRSKDGKNWNKISTITDTEIADYEDRDIADGDACGYIVCSFAGENKSENSVPEYTCFLKNVNIKSVKSNASKKLNIKWTTSQNASGYQIRVSTTKSFTNSTTVEKKIYSKSESSKTIGKLKGGRKYYVQIRAYRTYNGEDYYSEWSSTKSVKVKR